MSVRECRLYQNGKDDTNTYFNNYYNSSCLRKLHSKIRKFLRYNSWYSCVFSFFLFVIWSHVCFHTYNYFKAFFRCRVFILTYFFCISNSNCLSFNGSTDLTLLKTYVLRVRYSEVIERTHYSFFIVSGNETSYEFHVVSDSLFDYIYKNLQLRRVNVYVVSLLTCNSSQTFITFSYHHVTRYVRN